MWFCAIKYCDGSLICQPQPRHYQAPGDRRLEKPAERQPRRCQLQGNACPPGPGGIERSVVHSHLPKGNEHVPSPCPGSSLLCLLMVIKPANTSDLSVIIGACWIAAWDLFDNLAGRCGRVETRKLAV